MIGQNAAIASELPSAKNAQLKIEPYTKRLVP
jgi:hypothetical protein